MKATQEPGANPVSINSVVPAQRLSSAVFRDLQRRGDGRSSAPECGALQTFGEIRNGFQCSGIQFVRFFFILTGLLFAPLVQAGTCDVPPPPAGRQAKVASVIDLGRDRSIEIFTTGVSDGGSGYPPDARVPMLLISSSGSGAQYNALTLGDSVYYVSGADTNGHLHLGSGYSDDLAMVIPPPHTNDFGNYLTNSGCTTIQLDSGTYYQNAIIDRDVTIRGKGMGKTVVSGGLLGTVFKILPGHTVHLEDLTIVDGLALNGGGIYNDGSALTLDRVEIKNCRAYAPAGEGGGIYNKGAAILTLNDCNIHDNAATRDGGGISNSGINTSFLPVAAGSAQHAAQSLEDVFAGFVSQPAARDLDETSAMPSGDTIDSILDQLNNFLGNVVDTIGDIPELFDSAIGETFGASGWSNIGSPTTKINRSTITRNKTGIGIANSQTYLFVVTPIITGHRYTPDGYPIDIVGGYSNILLHPPDIRIGAWGGGIHNDLGLLVVQDSTINNNEVKTRLGSFGGGISSFLGAVLITNTPLTFNRSEVTTVLPSGGAIFSFASFVRCSDSKLNNNTVKAGLFLSSGGAIKNTGLSFTEFLRCELNNNQSGGGGGAANDYLAHLFLTACTVRSNFVSGIIGAEGGGIRNGEGGILNLDSCLIADNRGEGKAKGGGIFNHCEQVRIGPAEFPIIPISVSSATIRNCTISGNSLRGVGLAGIPLEARGGGIYNGSFDLGIATVNLYSSTVCSNSATGGVFHSGGGVWTTAASSLKINPLENIPGFAAIIRVANDLFLGNVPNDVDKSFVPLVSFVSSDGYNMDSDGTGRQTASGFTTATNRLTPLSNNGGLTQTHALLPGSAGLNAGSPDGALSEEKAPLNDQRGVPRSNGGRRDVGAFEHTPPLSFPEMYTTFEDQQLVIAASNGLLANDYGTALAIVPFNLTVNGTGPVSSNGSFTFTPAPNFNGTFDVPYQAVDISGLTGAASFVRLTVKPRLDLLSINPSPNSVLSNLAENIVLQFDETVSVEGAQKIVMEGSLSGPIPFKASVVGRTVTLDPLRAFQAGEVVSLRLSTNVQSVAGSPVFPGINYQFIIASTNGAAVFPPGQNLGPAQPNPGYYGANKLIFVDIDRDGDLDIVGTELGNNVWRNDGHGHFTPANQALTCPGSFTPASDIAVSDLNGDGFPDVFLTSDNIYGANCVWLNNGNGTFSRGPNSIILDTLVGSFGHISYVPAAAVALGDVNGDGYPDAVLMGGGVHGANQVWMNDGQANFTRSQTLDGTGSGAQFADLNGDGFLDIVITDDNTYRYNFQPVRVWLNDRTGHFIFSGQTFGIDAARTVLLGDLNGDGTVDAVIVGTSAFSGGIPGIWFNDGSGAFSPGQQMDVGYYESAVLADFNADGSLDLVFADKYRNNVVWLNDGQGHFSKSSEYVGNSSTGIAAGDINGNGSVDLLASGNENQIFLNVRRPTAGTPPSFSVNENELLIFAQPSTLLSTASSPSGSTVHVLTNQTITFKGTLGEIWFTFGFDVDPPYEGVYPNGTYYYSYVTAVAANHGTLELRPDGTFSYRPNPYYFGPDSFTYTVNDGFADSLPVTVHIDVLKVPQVPIARNNWYTGDFWTGGGVWWQFDLNHVYDAFFFLPTDAGSGVLANDTELNGDPLTAVLDSLPSRGSLTFNPDGSFRYVPSSGTFDAYFGVPGIDRFTYHVTNAFYASTSAVVTIGYDVPVAVNDEYPLAPGQSLTVDQAHGVLANDSDPNFAGDPNLDFYAALRVAPLHGTLQLDRNGSFTYTPNSGHTGGDVFFYDAHDFLAGSGIARVKLGNTAPVAVDDTNYVAFNGKTLAVDAAHGVLVNDSDPDGDSGLTASLVSPPSNGTVQLNPDGSFSYTAVSNFFGVDTFTYRVSDGRTNSNTATVAVRASNFLTVLSSSPARNALTAPADTDMEITFNAPLIAATVSNRISVSGSFSGRRTFSAAVSGTQLHLDFASHFQPGEWVTVTLAEGMQGMGFYQLENHYALQFQIGVSRGGATFTRSVAGSTTTNFSHSVVLGDLNGDGFPDALVANRVTLPTLLSNNHNGTFTERTESLNLVGVDFLDVAPVLADFNGDGRLDLLVQGQADSGFGFNAPRLSLGLNDGTGHFPTIKTVPINGEFGTVYLPIVMLVGDFDGNGTIDVLGANFSRAWLWRNDGAGNLILDEASAIPIRDGVQTGAVGDLNNDGRLDIYLTGFYGDQLLLNDGTGHFSASNQALSTRYSSSLALTDVDGDGSLDVILNVDYPNGNEVWINDGAGHFTKNLFDLAYNTASAIAAGDLNGDGTPDLWQANNRDVLNNGGGDTVWTSDGTGRFTRAGPAWGSSGSLGIALADLDGDGDLDAFVVNNSSSSGTAGFGNEVWLNQSPPIARDDFYAANGSSAVSVAANGVLANDSLGDHGSIIAILANAPDHGTVVLNTNGGFTYTPNGTFAGTDVFTYRAQDSSTSSAPARVKIGNTTPVANNDGPVAVVSGVRFQKPAPGVLENDTDAEGDPLLALLVSGPTNGTLTLKPNGSYIYTPASGFTGADIFTYRATDRLSTSAVATVSLSVQALLEIVAVSPKPSSVNIPANSSISIQFNHPINTNSLDTNVILLGSFTGPRPVTFAFNGNTLALIPTEPFLPSELVTLTVLSSLHGAAGESLPGTFQAQFIAEAPSGSGAFSDSGQRIGETNYNTFGVALGDLNGDGSLDAIIPNGAEIIGTNIIPGVAHVWTNNGFGQFFDSGRILGTNNSFDAKLGDLNGDGSLDVVYESPGRGAQIWLNDGSGNFSLLPHNFGTNSTAQVSLADMNGDGALDLIILGTSELRIYLNDATGHFTENPASVQNLSFNNQNWSRFAAGDLNGDGTMDLVLQDFFTSRPSRILLNDGHANLTDTGLRFDSGQGLGLGDLNGDGYPDLFMPSGNGSYLWLNDGAGSFTNSGKAYFGNFVVRDVQLADVNSDGTLDAIVIQYNTSGPLTNMSTIYLNDGQGNFTDSHTRFDALGFGSSGGAIIPTTTTVGDVNGDGATDLFVGGGLRQRNQVWFNQATLPTPLGAQKLTINDTQTVQPFSQILVRGPGSLSVKVALDTPAKGAFLPGSLIAGGFTGPLGGYYTLASTTASAAQTALHQLVFAPTPNRVPVGSNEVTRISLVLSDGSIAKTNSSTLVTSISVNDRPVAQNDGGIGFTTSETVAFTTASVLTNDTDADPGDILSVTSLTLLSTLGNVTNLGNGTFRYDPNGKFKALPAGQTATDRYGYSITDSHGATANGLVTITITGVNQMPAASNVVLVIDENSGSQVVTPRLLAGATDPDTGENLALSISAVNTAGTLGTVQRLAGDVVTYNPNGAFPNLAPGSTATDSFGFTVTDGHGGFSSARANITIRGKNEGPTAGLTLVAVMEHSGETNLTSIILGNATDPDPGETATLQLTSIDTALTVGSVVLTNGVVTYSPDGQFQSLVEGQTNVDTFNYEIKDIHGAINVGTAQIIIIGQNDIPGVTPSFMTVDDGSAPVELTSSLLGTATDPDNGETATLRITSLDTNGLAGLLSLTNGVVMYHPPLLFLPSGTFITNGFRYVVEDVHGATSNGVGVIYIVGVNTAPEIDCGSPAVVECSTNTTSTSLAATVNDADGNALEVVWKINDVIAQTNSLPATTPPNSNSVTLVASLPLGTNTIVVSVSDGIAPLVFCTNTVTVLDTVAPQITILGANPYTNECHTAFIDPGATAMDACAGSLTVVTNALVNADVPGSYTVTYSTVDPAGNATTNYRTVVVLDTAPPSITCPATIFVDATNISGNVVSYTTPTASDLCSGTNVTIRSQPASGTLFGFGTNIVNCEAVDQMGNTGRCSFAILILGPRSILLDALARLTAMLPGTSNPGDISSLNQIIESLTEATDLSLWIDEAHLQAKVGIHEFTSLSLDTLCQLAGSSSSSLPRASLGDLITRIESAERLLGVIAIQQAIAYGAAGKRIEQALNQLSSGDADAAAGRCSACLAKYKNAWNMAMHAMLVESVHVDSQVHIEVLGDANKVYLIEASTDLIHWTVLATVKANADGIVQYNAGPASQYPTRFYRTVAQ